MCVRTVFLAAIVAAVSTAIAQTDDHQNMMDQLGVKSIRPGPNPKDPSTFDESKADRYMDSMPDVLRMNDGAPVTMAAQWPARRRQIAELFEREVYGRIPGNVPPITWQATSTTRVTNSGVATFTRKLIGHVDNSSDPQIAVDVQASVTVPVDASKPVPVMVEFSGFGFGPPRGPASQPHATFRFARPPGPSWQDQAIAKGWGYATINPASIQPDNDQLNTGIIGLTNKGQASYARAVGCAARLAVGGKPADRLLRRSTPDWKVDATKVGIEGLSRYGKAALVTEAFEPRIVCRG